jgi:hypothetical protein
MHSAAELRDEMRTELRQQRARIAELEAIIRDCQAILTEHLPPDGMSRKDAISLLLKILDGPRTRSAMPNKQ